MSLQRRAILIRRKRGLYLRTKKFSHDFWTLGRSVKQGAYIWFEPVDSIGCHLPSHFTHWVDYRFRRGGEFERKQYRKRVCQGAIRGWTCRRADR